MSTLMQGKAHTIHAYRGVQRTLRVLDGAVSTEAVDGRSLVEKGEEKVLPLRGDVVVQAVSPARYHVIAEAAPEEDK